MCRRRQPNLSFHAEPPWAQQRGPLAPAAVATVASSLWSSCVQIGAAASKRWSFLAGSRLAQPRALTRSG